MKQKDLKLKIDNYADKGKLLEAFVLQSAYIESLMKLYAELKFSLSFKDAESSVVKALRDRIEQYGLYELTVFMFDCNWLPRTTRALFDNYRKKRNQVLHDLVRRIAEQNFDLEIRETYGIGQQIIALPAFHETDKAFRVIESQNIRGNNKSFISRPLGRNIRITERENTVLGLRLEGKTYEEIGRQWNVSRERIRQILSSAISKVEGREVIPRSSAPQRRAVLDDVVVGEGIDQLLNSICKTYAISKSELLGTRRMARLVFPRHLAVYYLKKNLGLSFPKIGRIMKRDHTTAVHAFHKMEELISSESKQVAKPTLPDRYPYGGRAS